MTHEALLERIRWSEASVLTSFKVGGALRAVVEVHYPESEDGEVKCWTCNTVYPCLTISTVERALK